MDNRIKILAVAIAIVVLSVGTFLAIVKTEKPTDEFLLRSFYTGGDALGFADELGYLKEAGIKLDKVGSAPSGGPATLIAVATGTADIGGAAWIAVINAQTQGVKIKSIFGYGGTFAYSWIGNGTPWLYKWIVLENSSIRSVQDLIGKRIAVNTLGAHADYFTREYLKRAGISKEQVELVVMPVNQMELALRKGGLDVIAPSRTDAAKILASGGVRVLFSDYDIRGEFSVGPYSVPEKLIKEHPDIVRRLVGALAKAIEWSRQNPEKARELVAKILKDEGGNPDLAKYFNGFGARRYGLIADSDIQFWIDWLVADGKLQPEQIKPSDIYTNEYNPYLQGGG